MSGPDQVFEEDVPTPNDSIKIPTATEEFILKKLIEQPHSQTMRILKLLYDAAVSLEPVEISIVLRKVDAIAAEEPK